jgi:hypothetical protein
MSLELIRNGMEAEKRKQREFLKLAGRFRNATDPAEVEGLDDQMVHRPALPQIDRSPFLPEP